MKEPVIKHITTHYAEYQALLNFRNELLRKPLGLDLFSEDLSDDEKDFIIIAQQEDEIVGCLMLHPVDKKIVKLRQMAVSDTLQGQGIGSRLVIEAEELAAKKKYRKILLHARRTAEDFYKKLGYNTVGNTFLEVTIPHIAMEKTL
jgi:N-acetylglutamate synthase-like GNAT family acetyltransferase